MSQPKRTDEKRNKLALLRDSRPETSTTSDDITTLRGQIETSISEKRKRKKEIEKSGEIKKKIVKLVPQITNRTRELEIYRDELISLENAEESIAEELIDFFLSPFFPSTIIEHLNEECFKNEFDYVFKPNSTQEGYSCCIFAYGQTGAGKTYTMQGSDDTPESEVNLESPSRVNQVLRSTTKNRTVASTKMNDNSSRSHSIFMIYIEGSNSVTSEKRSSSLNLIDLAGSERLSIHEPTGDLQAETININKSLSSLKTVIQKIKENAVHINYRDSTLTYILKNLLGGDSKVLMLVNISPVKSSRKQSRVWAYHKSSHRHLKRLLFFFF